MYYDFETIIEKRKPIDQEIEKLFKTVLKINTETERCVFFNFSPHCNVIHIRVSDTKRRYNKVIEEIWINCDKDEREVKLTNENLKKLFKKWR